LNLTIIKYNNRPDGTSGKKQRLATVATLIVWALAQSRGVGHRSLVIPERVLSEYNKDLIFFLNITYTEKPVFLTYTLIIMGLI